MICFIIVYIMRWEWVSQSQSNEEQFQVCHPPPPPKVCCRRGQGREALEWPYTMGGGGVTRPPDPLPPTKVTIVGKKRNLPLGKSCRVLRGLKAGVGGESNGQFRSMECPCHRHLQP